jgi:hypothetical protein
MIRITLLSVVIAFFMVSCTDHKHKSAIVSTKEIIIDSMPGECPYLTKDQQGNTVLSWVRLINDSTAAFCYAVSRDGKSFANPVIIPGSNNIKPHGENLPKILFKPSGEIIALWGAANPNPKNKYSGLVFYVQSFDQGKTWTSPTPLTPDTASYDQRYYDVAVLSNGEAGIIWLDNRKTTTREGSGLYFASTEGKNGFQQDRLISQPCCQCCRTDLYVDSKGTIHALYRGIIQDSIRDMVHISSADGARTFSSPRRISDDNWVLNGCPHTGPAMTESSNGIEFAWFTGGKNKGCYYANSNDNCSSFSPRTAISESGSHPQLAALTNQDVVVVWDETVKQNNKFYKRIGVQKRNADKDGGNDFITADTLTSTYPVVSPIEGNRVVIAYTANRATNNYIACQVVTFQ